MEYVNRCTLAVNGQSIDDFKSFTDNERELRKSVNLMNKTGHCRVTERPGCKLDYVVPMDADEFNFEEVEGGTLTVEYENGTRITFSGVSTAKIGEAKIDGENEVVRTIEFIAEGRAKE